MERPPDHLGVKKPWLLLLQQLDAVSYTHLLPAGVITTEFTDGVRRKRSAYASCSYFRQHISRPQVPEIFTGLSDRPCSFAILMDTGWNPLKKEEQQNGLPQIPSPPNILACLLYTSRWTCPKGWPVGTEVAYRPTDRSGYVPAAFYFSPNFRVNPTKCSFIHQGNRIENYFPK